MSLVFVGRILAGIGLGNEAVIYAYLSAVIPASDRSFAVSAMQFAIAFAFMLGPFISIGLSFIQEFRVIQKKKTASLSLGLLW